MLRILAALAALFLAVPAPAQVEQKTATGPAAVRATSPDGNIEVTVTTDGDGRPYYSVSRSGKIVIRPSRLGFLLGDAPKLERDFAIIGQETSKSDSSWDQPWGEWKTIRDNHVELRVRLQEQIALRREMVVVFRLFDDGIGFRYELPAQPNLKTMHIADELTEFDLAQDGTAWWIPGAEWNRDEYLWHKTPIREVPLAHTPLTLKLDDGTHVAIHEAALVDYSGMWLQGTEGGTKLKAVLEPGAMGPKVSRVLPFATPWRTIVITDDAPGLYRSHIELNLNEPNKLGDVSWFKPGKYVGVWWEMHLDKATWSTGAKHGATTANVKHYIDFAAANGFKGVLAEGWNVGWDGHWFANGNDFQFDKPTPDFDADALAAYARKKGVQLIGHHETGGSTTHYEQQLDRAFAFAQAHGESVVKTGYVTDAGQLERVEPDGRQLREWHDGQYSANHHLKVVTTAAKYKIAIDSHEPIKDTGLRRTYPNWISSEHARGMEYNGWGNPKNPPEHEANLVFTRMLAGPMDFTPGVLSLVGKGDTPIESTIAKQLALYVVIYSPVQMAADLPENYARFPGPMRFIKDVPTDWIDTRVLNGEVGDYVTFARQARDDPDWYLGAVGDEQARTLSVKLDFLTPSKRYEAQIYRDGDDADYRGDKRFSIAIEKKRVTAEDTLVLKLAPGGGQAIRFKAL
ncbi:glycoside hydrolase family 97 protein [Sphingomonas sp. HITSZ_GF]|uniref:glycoside hydrolase family 97 protein n=1 Tax=Sphingomonas sp. HITSZ_GF TaxID=3037247 RepID=UPI00240E16CE|nr:glycoside hydrolase family 97 protein [Sphingomonas sp. HITSZ_GF]MDG2535300.1 glycoside hydrolase family 97 protein [Sphingomonas sp. HITSZ_GF]